MDLKPIPAFYCCYLLRSTVRHASTYIGSSPDPARRIGQHNGKVKGGAVRTSRASLRPWEMGCIVAGFPSNIAALQFEWAWHNAHLTRHISPEQRISFATPRTKTSRSGKVTKRPGRPRGSLLDKLSNLHLLLRAPYFSKWPLEVRFFSEEFYRSWTTWCERVDSQIRPGIKVLLDPARHLEQEDDEFSSAQPRPSQTRKRKADLLGKGGPEGIDPTYARLRGVFEKSQFLLDEDDDQQCSSISHVSCLADASLERQQSASMVPETATCPSCTQERPWLEWMQQVTLRNRGPKEVKKLLGKKGKKSIAAVAAEIIETESEDSDMEEDALTAKHVVDEEAELSSQGDEDDGSSVASADSFLSRTSNDSRKGKAKSTVGDKKKTKGKLEMVIEDSEDER
ncbi:Slx4p interacting protein [Cladophialophora chaetospira]|uniref:Slx4p interacting protein n=1 Tax=Cladophialophora chaetospira TaxID=386627 RepID=A0AA38XPA2_9EURO|nr:Slx4p interacting protein [Cladophialophora chaetospira]